MSPPSRLRPPISALFVVFALALSTPLLRADTALLGASKDNTLYSESGSLSNGAGEFLFAGRTLLDDDRRALLAFDLSSIPAGSTINSVTLSLKLSKAPGGSGTTPMTLHRALADWGQGASDAGAPGGTGAPAQLGDATWLHAFFPSTFWTTSGGDFVAGASASASVEGTGNIGNAQLWSSVGMVADVQAWLDNGVPNFGWILIGDEASPGEARRFDSRESPAPAFRPLLTVDFTTPSGPSLPLDLKTELLGNDVKVSFPTVTGTDYTLQTSTGLQIWTNLTMTSGDDSLFEFDHVGGGADVRRYYRVVRTL